MGKRQANTPRSQIHSVLRRLFLRSRERAAAIKREENSCERCGKKGSKEKGREVMINVHHRDGIGNWDKIIDMIYEELLCNPDGLEILCKPCHDAQHEDVEDV